MNILIDFIEEELGNDCVVSERYALVEDGNEKRVLRHTVVSGSFEDNNWRTYSIPEATAWIDSKTALVRLGLIEENPDAKI